MGAAGTLIRWIRKNIWGVIILLVAYFGTNYVVNHFKKPGQMSVIEAQGMDMNAMKPPVGSAPVLTEVAQTGDFTSKVTYTGTVVAYTDQDIYPRVTGRIVEMSLYPGDRVKAGQVVARLDTAELGAREETAAFGHRAALEETRMAQAELNRARKMRSEAQARLAAAKSGLKEAEHQLEAGRQEQEEAQAALSSAQDGVEEAQADVRMAQADVDYWKAEIKRAESLLKGGAISQEEYDREKAMTVGAEAKLRQTEAKVRQMEADVRMARARIRKVQATVAGMTAKVAQMQSEAEAMRAGIETAQAEIDMAARKVGSNQAMADQARAAWREAAVVKGYTDITTPVSGVVTSRPVSPGVLVGPGTPILKIAEVGKVRLQANVPEKDLANIRAGNPVWVRTMEGAKNALQARVTSIFPAADPVARTAIVEAVVPNPGLKLIPGQYIVMEIATSRRQEAVTVPSKAIVYTSPQETGIFFTEKKPAVWVASETKSSGKTEYYCPMHPDVVSDKPGTCPKCKMDLVPREQPAAQETKTEYYCVMHPEVVSDKPGICPKCKMDLVPKEKQAAGEEKTEYYCVMHPDVVSDKPGICPKCKMDLEPRTKGGAKKAHLVQVTLGPSDGKRTVILSGLKAGQEVIVTGNEYLREGDSVSTGGLIPGAPANPPTMESIMGGERGGKSSGDKGNMGDMPGM